MANELTLRPSRQAMLELQDEASRAKALTTRAREAGKAALTRSRIIGTVASTVTGAGTGYIRGRFGRERTLAPMAATAGGMVAAGWMAGQPAIAEAGWGIVTRILGDVAEDAGKQHAASATTTHAPALKEVVNG